MNVPPWIILVTIYLGSSALNVVFWWKTPEEWEAFCLAHPRLSGIVRLMRAMGFDLPRAIRAVEWITKGYRAVGWCPPPKEKLCLPPPEDINTDRKA